jgi:hypothetical protein
MTRSLAGQKDFVGIDKPSKTPQKQTRSSTNDRVGVDRLCARDDEFRSDKNNSGSILSSENRRTTCWYPFDPDALLM